MLFVFYGLLALVVYLASPGRAQWWMILAGNALFYTLSDKKQIFVSIVSGTLCIYRIKHNRNEKTA